TLDPEENESYEAGVKYSLLGGKLGLSGALFRVEKSNAYYTDSTGNSVASGEKQRVQGVELGLSGSITDKWMVSAAYT
ncbi:TonB-dependent receptor domain-containing protein, partial [Kosakonia radicincitans]|uniref:TonB-dependent receptor domain-containing protein n=1 Tax=Kosakonia radicincitans TaxID=283686 RepID=UPI002368867E